LARLFAVPTQHVQFIAGDFVVHGYSAERKTPPSQLGISPSLRASRDMRRCQESV
jgi:hypothetical protein